MPGVYKYCILSAILILSSFVSRAQEHRREFRLWFAVNKYTAESEFGDNSRTLSSLDRFLTDIKSDSLQYISSVELYSSSSPDGGVESNAVLTERRLKTLSEIIKSKIDLPDSIVTRRNTAVWPLFRELVAKSEVVYKPLVLYVIDSPSQRVPYYGGQYTDKRILDLRALRGGHPWKYISENLLDSLRYAGAVITTARRALPESAPEPEPTTDSIPTLASELLISEVDCGIVTASAEPSRAGYGGGYFYLKTNALAWVLATTNVAAEIDIARHLSFSLPIYYSAWNYFTFPVKFRIFAVQPELRWWFSPYNDGLFAGAHFGLAYFDYAFNGTYRYQDHRYPALGGGVSVGYRLPVSRDGRWKAEFSVGAGAYSVWYDEFYNVPNGMKVNTVRRNYWGLDNAAVTFSYTFDLKKRGGSR